MRKLKRISPSALRCWETNQEEAYLRYISPTRPDRAPQHPGAGVGSAFDAYVKNRLHTELIGDNDGAYSLDMLIKNQVEPQNLEVCVPAGEHVFEFYQECGAYDHLKEQIKEPPQLEFEIEISIGGVPIMGKPDLHYQFSREVKVVHDWKVEGYFSKSTISPAKGYRYVWPDAKIHKLHVPRDFHGYEIGGYMEDYNTHWADQLCMYGWALGQPVGNENVVYQIHQIVGKPGPEGRPILRCAEFRCQVRESYQQLLVKRLQKMWWHFNNDHYLAFLSKEESQKRCAALDRESEMLVSDGTPEGDFFVEAVQRRFRG